MILVNYFSLYYSVLPSLVIPTHHKNACALTSLYRQLWPSCWVPIGITKAVIKRFYVTRAEDSDTPRP